MMWSFIANQIPWWVYLVLLMCGAAVAWVFFGPVLTMIWGLLPKWVKVVLGFILAVMLAIVYGRNKGYAQARLTQQKLDEHAELNRQEIHNDVVKRDEPTVDRDLDKWMRDK